MAIKSMSACKPRKPSKFISFALMFVIMTTITAPLFSLSSYAEGVPSIKNVVTATKPTVQPTVTAKPATTTATEGQVASGLAKIIDDYTKESTGSTDVLKNKAFLEKVESKRGEVFDDVIRERYFVPVTAYRDVQAMITNGNKASVDVDGDYGYYIFPLTKATVAAGSDLVVESADQSGGLANNTGVNSQQSLRDYFTVGDIAANPALLARAKFQVSVGGTTIDLFNLDSRMYTEGNTKKKVYSNIMQITMIHKAIYDFNKSSSGGKNGKASDLVVCLDSYGNIVTNTGELIFPFYAIPYYYEKGTIAGLPAVNNTAQNVKEGKFNRYGKHVYPSGLLQSVYGGMQGTVLTNKAITGDKYFYIKEADGDKAALSGNYTVNDPFAILDLGKGMVVGKVISETFGEFKKYSGAFGQGTYFSNKTFDIKNPVYVMNGGTDLQKIAKLTAVGDATLPSSLNKELMQLIALGVRDKMVKAADIQGFGHADAKIPSMEDRQKQLNEIAQADFFKKITMIFDVGLADMLIATISGLVDSLYVWLYLPSSKNALFFTQNVTSMPIISYFSKNLVTFVVLTIMFFAVFDAFRVTSGKITFKKYLIGFGLIVVVWVAPFWLFPKFIDLGINTVSEVLMKPNINEVTVAQRYQYLKLTRENSSLQAFVDTLNSKTNLKDILANEASFGSTLRIGNQAGVTDEVDTNKYIDRFIEPTAKFSDNRIKDVFFADPELSPTSFYPYIYDNLLRSLTPATDEQPDLAAYHKKTSAELWQQGKFTEVVYPKNILYLDSFNKGEDFLNLMSVAEKCANLMPGTLKESSASDKLNKEATARKIAKITKRINEDYRKLLEDMPNNMDKYAVIDVMALLAEFEMNKEFLMEPNGLFLQDVNMDLMTKYLLVPKENIAVDSVMILSHYIAAKDSWVTVLLFGLFVIATIVYSVLKMIAFYALCLLIFFAFTYNLILKEDLKNKDAIKGSLFIMANLMAIQLLVLVTWLIGIWFINTGSVDFAALPKRFTVIVLFTALFYVLTRYALFRIMKTAVTHAGSLGWSAFQGVLSFANNSIGSALGSLGERLGITSMSQLGANMQLRGEMQSERSRVWREAALGSLSGIGRNPLSALPFSKAQSERESSLLKSLSEYEKGLSFAHATEKEALKETFAEKHEKNRSVMRSLFKGSDPAVEVQKEAVNAANNKINSMVAEGVLDEQAKTISEFGGNIPKNLDGYISKAKLDYNNIAHSTTVKTQSVDDAKNFADFLKVSTGLNSTLEGAMLTTRGSFTEVSDLYKKFVNSTHEANADSVKTIESEGGRFVTQKGIKVTDELTSVISAMHKDNRISDAEFASIGQTADGFLTASPEAMGAILKEKDVLDVAKAERILTPGRESEEDIEASLTSMGLAYVKGKDGSYSVTTGVSQTKAEFLQDYNKALKTRTAVKAKEIDGLGLTERNSEAILQRIADDGIAADKFYHDTETNSVFFSPELAEYSGKLKKEYKALAESRVIATSSSAANLEMAGGLFEGAAMTGFGLLVNDFSAQNVSKKIRTFSKNGLAAGVTGLKLALETGEFIADANRKDDIRLAFNSVLPKGHSYSINKDNVISVKNDKGEELTNKELVELYDKVGEELDYSTILRSEDTKEFEAVLTKSYLEGKDYDLKEDRIILYSVGAKQELERYNLKKWNALLKSNVENADEAVSSLECVEEVSMADNYFDSREHDGTVVEFGAKTPVLTSIVLDLLTGSTRSSIINTMANYGITEEDIVITPKSVIIIVEDNVRAYYAMAAIFTTIPTSWGVPLNKNVLETGTAESTGSIKLLYTGRDLSYFMTITIKMKHDDRKVDIAYAVTSGSKRDYIADTSSQGVLHNSLVKKLPYFVKKDVVYFLDLQTQKFKPARKGTYELAQGLNVTGDVFYSEVDVISDYISGALMSTEEYRESIAKIKEYVYAKSTGERYLSDLGVDTKISLSASKYVDNVDNLIPFFVPLAKKALNVKTSFDRSITDKLDAIESAKDLASSTKDMLNGLDPETAKEVAKKAKQLASEYAEKVKMDGLSTLSSDDYNREVDKLKKAGVNTDSLIESFKTAKSKNLSKEDLAAIVDVKEE